MFGWKTWLAMLMPMLQNIGIAKINEDENDTGSDDIIGQGILFGIMLLGHALKGDASAIDRMLPQSARKLVTQKDFESVPTSG